MRIVVYEHVSGGGYAQQPIPTDVLSEGFAMLRCVVADFKAAGHQVAVLLDARILKLNSPIEADSTIPIIYSNEPKKFLSNIAKKNDAVYVIAPETGQTLQAFIELVQETGKTSLNSDPQAISQVSDKSVLYESLRKKGFSIPKTITLNITDSSTDIKQAIKRELKYPVIIKPADGTGGSGISLIKEETEIEKATNKIKTTSTNTLFIAQEFVNGESASISLLSNGNKALAISLNKQNITLDNPDGDSSYNGGCIPYDHPLSPDACILAQKVVEAFSGLRGYVGVDVILSQDKIVVVEVNPRLTTSYIGLRQVAGFNIAQAIVDAVIKKELPTKIRDRGVACFSKIQTSKPTIKAYQKTTKIALIAPPFPLSDSIDAYSILMGYGDNVQDASLRLEEAKKQLLNIIC